MTQHDNYIIWLIFMKPLLQNWQGGDMHKYQRHTMVQYNSLKTLKDGPKISNEHLRSKTKLEFSQATDLYRFKQ